MRSWYSCCSALVAVDITGMMEACVVSTRALQIEFHRRFPAPDASSTSSSSNCVLLNNSLPTLSACLSKKRCNTMMSVSSYAVSSHSSCSSSEGTYFYDSVRQPSRFVRKMLQSSTLTSLRYLVISTMFAERKSLSGVMCPSLPKKMLLARF